MPSGRRLLLQNLHASVPRLTQLFAAQSVTFPPEPTNTNEGERVLDFFAHELGMGARSLRTWREGQHKLAQRRFHAESSTTPAPLIISNAVCSTKDGWRWPLHHDSPPGARKNLYLQPREQDRALLRSAVKDLHILCSPFVALSPPGTTTPPSSSPPSPRPTTEAESSRFVATHPIPAGMFLLSIPTDAAFFAQPPSAQTPDPLLTYFLHVEDLIGQLVAVAEEGPSASHHGYVEYLKQSIVPCRNLPFLQQADMEQLLPTTATTTTTAVGGGGEQSPAWALWRFLQSREGQPLSPYLERHLSSPAEYAWWVSAVLSRRAGAATLVPLLDKLNHSPLPNTHYTISTPSAFCGLDILDNLLAGVELQWLYEPYIHLFALRDLHPGEELTLCYASAPDGCYRAADRSPPPPRPPGLERDGQQQGRGAAAGRVEEADLHKVVGDLFPTRTSKTDAPHDAAHQEIESEEGRARWQLQWGFVPPCDAFYSERDLREVAAIVAERRVDTRAQLFPPE